MVCAERVRRGVEDGRVSSGALRLAVSVSIGVASRDEQVADADSLLKRTDQSLHLARESGPNRVAAVQLRPYEADSA